MEATVDRTLMRRFEREAQVTAMMTSPHAVRVFDYGMSNDGALYFAMELLDGRDLGRLVREDGPRSPAETVRIAREVCDALGEAHNLGLVHRDLKPENLMSARIGLRDDFIKVLDFGVVELRRRLEMRSQKSALASAPVAGTPGYMAPEMITSSGADGRADLYQLGCIMFFLLTGRNVFEDPSAVATAMAHVTAPPPRVEDVLGRRIPEELEAIVARCLAKDPAQRFPSAEAVDGALALVPLPTIVMTERVEGLLH
jgi:serine/threonine-protein kinase